MLESAQSLLEFEAKQKGATYRLSLVRFAEHFWLRSEELEDWLVLVEDGGKLLQMAWRMGNSAQMQRRVELALKSHHLGRALVWREGSEKWLLLWKGRQHAWMSIQTGQSVLFESQSNWHRGSFWTQSNERFRRRFAKEWQNPDCDVRNALAFLQTPYGERLHWNIAWRHGSWEETSA